MKKGPFVVAKTMFIGFSLVGANNLLEVKWSSSYGAELANSACLAPVSRKSRNFSGDIILFEF